MAEEEQQKEAQNQEQNAEATEAVEAGAEAVEETAGAEPKAPSVLVPMLLSAVITVVGVGVMVAVILPGQISKAIADASHHDGNSTGAHGKEDGGHGKEDGGHGEDGGGHGEDGGGHGEEGETEEGDAAGTEEDDPKKPEPIVPEGENIVINPAGSGGTRYLLVEIFLLRKDVEDKKFPAQVQKSTQLLQAVTVETLSAQSAQSLADPATKERLKHTLKLAYQEKLGEKHPIKELIVSKWIMQ